MLRVLLTIVLPLILPTTLYLAWVRTTQPAEDDRAVGWGALPWLWLAGAGTLLLVIVLFVVNVRFGSQEPGVYIPPRWENGHIVPGHVEPGTKQ
jgi:hypothetical protein